VLSAAEQMHESVLSHLKGAQTGAFFYPFLYQFCQRIAAEAADIMCMQPGLSARGAGADIEGVASQAG